jgi:hypothetical protein
MIGIILKVLTDLVEEKAGKETLKTIFETAGIPSTRQYIINKPYEDTEWQALFEATLKHLKLDKETIFQIYADAFINYVLQLFPSWFEMASNSKAFLKLQPIIHNSFASGLIDPQKRKTVVDKFKLHEKGDSLVIHYQSPNKLCQLYQALANSAAAYYHDEIVITETSCLLKGDPTCTLEIKWLKLGDEA